MCIICNVAAKQFGKKPESKSRLEGGSWIAIVFKLLVVPVAICCRTEEICGRKGLGVPLVHTISCHLSKALRRGLMC